MWHDARHTAVISKAGALMGWGNCQCKIPHCQEQEEHHLLTETVLTNL